MPSATSPRRSPPSPGTTTKPFAPPTLPPLAPVGQSPNGSNTATEPIAPAFSPITPRAVPALPAISIPPQPPPQNGAHTTAMSAEYTTPQPPDTQQPQPQSQPAPESKPAIAPTEYIPPPPSKPFSSEDSTDAIALRAAISSLQFQKKKAQDDIRTLENVRKQALDDPERFKQELAAGRVQEKKMTAGDLRAILDADSDDDDDDDEDDEDEIMKNTNTSNDTLAGAEPKAQPFQSIPGPQNVVRAPHINWDKYHIVGEPLDQIHEQQRKWPGNLAYGSDRGREFTVAAPYSPWLDPLEGGQERKDSGQGGSFSSASGVGGTVSEHPMETRRGGVRK